MVEAKIESIRPLNNPLDVLTQQLISICGQGDRTVDELGTRPSKPAFLIHFGRSIRWVSMASGHYPSTEFSDSPSSKSGTETAILSQAVEVHLKVSQSNAGTIPDRGLCR